jgi:hypothetical protein
VGHLRGVLVDVKVGLIVASSYGYTPTAVTNHLSFDQNNCTLVDQNQMIHEFQTHNTVIKRVYEGVILRVVYYNGEVYKLTHRKIRPMKSHWGDTPFFTNMYNEAQGPKDDQLFDLNKKYSPLCYVFLVVHPTLLIATKQVVTKPYVVLLNINTMYHPNQTPFDIQDIDLDLKPTLPFSNQVCSRVDESYLHLPENLSVEEANKHLQCGFYEDLLSDDLRLCPGEAVIMYKYNDKGHVVDILKVNSVAYNFRFNLRNNDPNPYHQFYELVNYSYKTLSYYVNEIEFKQKFAIIDNYNQNDLQSLLDQDAIIQLDTGAMTVEQKKDRLHILKQVWLNYLISLPYHHQKQALGYYEQFLKEREQVIAWLQRNVNLDPTIKLPDRAKSLILAAKQTANSLVQSGKATDLNKTVKDVIHNFVMKEYGSSLYSLVKAMKNM